MRPNELPFEWPALDETAGSSSQPGIYRIEIEDAGTYVGRYTRASRPLREYRNNVLKLFAAKPYRKAKPEGFRTVHHALYAAFKAGRRVKIEIVENVTTNLLNERERYWIERIPINQRLNGRRRSL